MNVQEQVHDIITFSGAFGRFDPLHKLEKFFPMSAFEFVPQGQSAVSRIPTTWIFECAYEAPIGFADTSVVVQSTCQDL